MSDDEFTSDSSSSGNASDEDMGDDSEHPIMSIFASYYGIEKPVAPIVENVRKGTIDDADFDPDSYVKAQSLLL